MNLYLLPLVLPAAGSDEKSSGSNLRQRLLGVWSIESMDVGLGETSRTTVPRAFMFFITKGHYSAIRDFTEPQGEVGSPPDRKFMADAGTYEFDGNDLVVHHEVAGFSVLGSMTFGVVMEGDDTLILTPQYDKMVMPGLDLTPKDGKMGYGDVATRYVFRRLE